MEGPCEGARHLYLLHHGKKPSSKSAIDVCFSPGRVSLRVTASSLTPVHAKRRDSSDRGIRVKELRRHGSGWPGPTESMSPGRLFHTARSVVHPQGPETPAGGRRLALGVVGYWQVCGCVGIEPHSPASALSAVKQVSSSPPASHSVYLRTFTR